MSLAFVRGIHQWPVDSPHKGPVTQKMFPSDGVIMSWTSYSKPQQEAHFLCWLRMNYKTRINGSHILRILNTGRSHRKFDTLTLCSTESELTCQIESIPYQQMPWQLELPGHLLLWYLSQFLFTIAIFLANIQTKLFYVSSSWCISIALFCMAMKEPNYQGFPDMHWLALVIMVLCRYPA